ncbi:MAG: alpha/beta fold hydrolase BchO [Pseudomonadota bacterium]
MYFGSDAPDWDEDGADWPLRAHSRFHRLDGALWHVQRLGAGPTVLLLHGTAAATHSWAPLAERLAENFDLVIPDLPGHGFTRRPVGKSLSIDYLADAVARLCDAVEARPLIVIGHSSGSVVAARMIAAGALRPALFISINGALEPFDGLAAYLFPFAARCLDINPFAAPAFAHAARNDRRVRRLIEGTGSTIPEAAVADYARLMRRSGHIAGALSMMANWDLSAVRSDMRALSIPALFLAGEHDRAVPPATAKRAAETAPLGACAVLPGLGHLAHEEDPDAVAAIIRERADAAALTTP